MVDSKLKSRKNRENIGIIGFMATGKSTIARILSKKLRMEYIDLDKLIEEKNGITIPEIFSIHGEEYFRGLEKEAVKEVSLMENTIVSYGGGVCLDPDNIVVLKNKSKIILLQARPEDILDRTKSDDTRPLLTDKKNTQAIKEIMDSRAESYSRAADIVIDTSGKSVMNVIDEILKILNAREY